MAFERSTDSHYRHSRDEEVCGRAGAALFVAAGITKADVQLRRARVVDTAIAAPQPARSTLRMSAANMDR